jgi:hypothetical protein
MKMTTEQRVGIMIDLESLDTGPRSVVTQVGVIAFQMDDPDTEIRRIGEYLPAQPQMELFKRTVSYETILWWMQQDDAARNKLKESAGNDSEVLLALVRSVHRKLSDLIRSVGEANVEIWARGPQFDIVNLESLFVDCGLAAPWRYDTVMDLRTLGRLAQVSSRDIDRGGLIPHIATEDCKFQIRFYSEALRNLTSAHRPKLTAVAD